MIGPYVEVGPVFEVVTQAHEVLEKGGPDVWAVWKRIRAALAQMLMGGRSKRKEAY